MTGAERRGGEGAWPVIFFHPALDIRTYVRYEYSRYPGAHSSFPFPHLWTGTRFFRFGCKAQVRPWAMRAWATLTKPAMFAPL